MENIENELETRLKEQSFKSTLYAKKPNII